MRNILERVKKFHNDESGDIVQTVIIIGVLALVAIGSLTILRDPIKAAFNNIKNAITNAGTTQSVP